MSMKIWRLGQEAEQERSDEHEDGKDDRNESSLCFHAVGGPKLSGKNLDAILEVHPRNVEAKCVA